MPHLKSLALLLVILLPACAQAVWVKPGVTEIEAKRDLYECRRGSRVVSYPPPLPVPPARPPDPAIYGPLGSLAPDPLGAFLQGFRHVTTFRAEREAEELFELCMEAKGYALERATRPVPEPVRHVVYKPQDWAFIRLSPGEAQKGEVRTVMGEPTEIQKGGSKWIYRAPEPGIDWLGFIFRGERLALSSAMLSTPWSQARIEAALGKPERETASEGLRYWYYSAISLSGRPLRLSFSGPTSSREFLFINLFSGE